MHEKHSLNLRGRRVLIVEDEYFLAMDLAERFEDLGVEVVGPAATVGDAIALLKAQQVEGAVLDINVRGQRVYPVADILKQRNVPFVFTSGYSSELEPDAYASIPRCIKPTKFGDVAQMLASEMSRGRVV
jgi:CheY-like chemotaxis protein